MAFHMRMTADFSAIDTQLYSDLYDDSFQLGLSRDFLFALYSNPVWEPLTKLLLVTDDNGQYVSGAAIMYRKLQLGEELVQVGIMSGAWTPQAYRGRGLMAKMIRFVLQDNEAHGVHYMCGFGLMNNVSARFEIGAGAFMHPAWYAFHTQPPADAQVLPVEEIEIPHAQLYERSYSSLRYTPAQFAVQYCLDKPGVRCLKIADMYALIEPTYNAQKVNLLTHGNLAQFEQAVVALLAHGQGQKFFFYTSDAAELAVLRRLGCEVMDGYFSVLPSGEKHRFEGPLSIVMGDRI